MKTSVEIVKVLKAQSLMIRKVKSGFDGALIGLGVSNSIVQAKK